MPEDYFSLWSSSSADAELSWVSSALLAGPDLRARPFSWVLQTPDLSQRAAGRSSSLSVFICDPFPTGCPSMDLLGSWREEVEDVELVSPCWRWRGLMEGPCCPFPSLFPLCWMTLFSPCPYFLLILWRGIFHCVYSKMHQCPGTYLLCCKDYDVNNSSSVSCWQGSPGRRGPQGEQGEPGPKVSLGVPWEVMHWGGWDHVIN